MATTAQHSPAGLQVMSRDDGPYRVYVPRVLHHVPPQPTWWQTEGTLVFADVSGFTRLSERLARQGRIGAEELVTTISGVFTQLLSATQDGGDVLKFGGDALLILYTGEDHAARACHAAQGMQRALRDAGRIVSSHGRVRLRMSVGVHTGDFPFFLIGERHLELVVTGPEATRTVEMEATADAGEILVSETTAAALPASALGDRKPPGVLLRRVSSMAPLASPPAAVETSDLEPYIPILLRGRLGPESEEHEHRQVTVSFVHFAGVDDILRQRGPAEVFDRLQALAEVVERTTTELGVCILTTDIGPDGGKYYLAAGAPDAADDDDGRMLRACRRIVDADVGLQLRAGVNRGHVFGGDVGAPFRRTYSVMGDPVNLAARIMGKAAFGTVLAEGSVVESARASFEVEPVPPFSVKGKTRPVDAVLVHRLAMVETTIDPREETHPLIGRTAELRALLDAARNARDGRGTVIDVVGDAGIGKSHLVRALLAQVEDLAIIEVACDPTDRLSPNLASRLLLRKALDISLRASDGETGTLVAQAIQRSAPHLEPWASLVATAAGGTLAPSEEVRQLAPQFRAMRSRHVVRDLLGAILGPTLIVIEDAFWMDDASADVLTGVVAAATAYPWLIVLSRRVVDSGLHPGLGFQAERLELTPLAGEEADAFTASIIERAPVPPAQLEEITRRAGGNPLFLIELLEAHHRGQGELPGSVEGVLAARIDELDPDDRATLRFVSVLGARIDDEVLDRSLGPLGITASQTERWHRLAHFIARDDGGLRFRHDLVREAAYEGLTFRRRRELHARVAAAYESLSGEGEHDHSPLLALHFHRAGLHDRAYPYALAAAEQAREGYANTLAATFYRQALEAAEHLQLEPVERASVAERLGDVLEVAGSYDEADAAYHRARAAANGGAQVRLLRKQGRLRERRGEVTTALRWYGRGITAASHLDDELTQRTQLGQLRVAYAVARFRQGRFRACMELCRRAVTDAEAAGDDETLAYALYVWGATLVQLDPSGEPTYLWEALRLYERLGDLLGQANTLDNLGVREYYQGDWDAAVDRYERSRQAALRAGDVVGAAVSEMNIGEILSDQGRLREAETDLVAARVVLHGAGYAVGVALCDAYLGRTYLRSGRLRDGSDLLERAGKALDALGSRAQALEAKIRAVEPLIALDDLEQAAQQIEACVAASAEDQNPALRSMALRLHGEVLHRQGRADEAGEALRASATVARGANVRYELAMTLRTMGRLGFDRDGSAAAESDQLFAGLGVVAVFDPLTSAVGAAAGPR